MSGAGKVWKDCEKTVQPPFYFWIYQLSDAAAQPRWLHSLIHKASTNISVLGFFDILTECVRYLHLNLEQLKTYCVNEHHGKYILNIQISWDNFIYHYMWNFLTKCFENSLKSAYPINWLKVDVFRAKNQMQDFSLKKFVNNLSNWKPMEQEGTCYCSACTLINYHWYKLWSGPYVSVKKGILFSEPCYLDLQNFNSPSIWNKYFSWPGHFFSDLIISMNNELSHKSKPQW